MKKTERRRLVGSIVLALGVAVLLLWIPFWEVSGDLEFVMWVAGTPLMCGFIIGILNKRHTIIIAIGFAIMVIALIVANALLSGIDFVWWVPCLMVASWIAWTIFGSELMRWLS